MSETTLQSLTRISKLLINLEPFYGFFLLGMNKVIVNKGLNTACVMKDGININLGINPEFWEPLSDLEKIAVLKHELLHIAFFHLFLKGEWTEDREMLNLAADFEVNQYIDDSYKGDILSKIILEIKNFPELNLPPKAGTKYYFEVLSSINKNRNRPDAKTRPLDNLKSHLDDPDDGSSPEKSKIWTAYDAMKRGEKIYCSHEEWDKFMEGMDEATKKLFKKQLEYRLKETSKSCKNRGIIPSELQSLINSLFIENPPVINWKEYVRRFAGSSDKIFTHKTRRKENKRFKENPALKIKTRKHILIGIDTSGSVGDNDLMDFFNEIHHIWKTGVKVTIAECDAAVSNVYEYKGEIPKSVKGRGGTDFDPIIEYYNENYRKFNSLIYLTDGYCSSPQTLPRTSMLWVISSDGSMEVELPGTKVQIQKISEN